MIKRREAKVDPIQGVIERACKKPTLAEALAFAALWECERVIPVAHAVLSGEVEGPWDTCFRFILQGVLDNYPRKRPRRTAK